MERALAEATPLEKAGVGALSSSGNRTRLRHARVVTHDVSGSDPLGPLLAKESSRGRPRKASPAFRSPQTPVTASVERGAAARR
jgi:hypothetical protein